MKSRVCRFEGRDTCGFGCWGSLQSGTARPFFWEYLDFFLFYFHFSCLLRVSPVLNLGRYQTLPLALPRNLVPESQLQLSAASHSAALAEEVELPLRSD